MSDVNRVALAKPVHAANALLENGRVPRLIHVDDQRRELQIQAHAASIRRKKDAAPWIVAKARNQIFALWAGHAAMKEHEIDSALLQAPGEQFVRAHPLA